MDPFTRLDAIAVPMPVPNVDTDQIIPARFLRKPRRDGFGQYLFHDLRFDDNGRERSEFVLNEPAYRGARILVADKNFGCGSSREHAVYALWDYGFRAVIATSYGDIFAGNCFKNAFLPVVLPAGANARLRGQVAAHPGIHLIIDLDQQDVVGPMGEHYHFEIDPYRKRCLLKGIDELEYTLGHRSEIEAFERRERDTTPWI
jgi:3-isopropylmalate/(R)-2-methylmalate dehydratase small subunit